MSSLREYLDDTHGDNVRVAFRHFPLSFHPLAFTAAEATEAAGAQGAFWEMHDLLYEHQQEWSGLSENAFIAQLASYADTLGLDVEQFSTDLENHTYYDKVEADRQSAVNAGLPGTPSYIMNGILYPSGDLPLYAPAISAFPALMEFEQYSVLPPQVLGEGKEYVATIVTTKGDIVVELFADQAPTNVNSFVFLANDGWYDDQEFFLVEQELAAHAGDPTGIGLGVPLSGFYCSGETSSELTFNEAGMLALYSPQQGIVISQFFITYVPLSQLNGSYTIIGRVTEGMDVLQSLTVTSPDPGQPEPDVIETITIEEK